MLQITPTNPHCPHTFFLHPQSPVSHRRKLTSSSSAARELDIFFMWKSVYALYVCVCVCARIMVCVFAIIINSSMSKFVNEVLWLWSEENRFSVKLTQSNVARCLLEINLLPRPLYFYHVCLSVCLSGS